MKQRITLFMGLISVELPKDKLRDSFDKEKKHMSRS